VQPSAGVQRNKRQLHCLALKASTWLWHMLLKCWRTVRYGTQPHPHHSVGRFWVSNSPRNYHVTFVCPCIASILFFLFRTHLCHRTRIYPFFELISFPSVLHAYSLRLRLVTTFFYYCFFYCCNLHYVYYLQLHASR
jgi:hypothetical protein